MRLTRLELGFALLCLISGTGWLLDAWRPSEMSAAGQLLFDSVLLAVVFAVVSSLMGAWPRERLGWLRLLAVGGLGLVLIAVPALLVSASGVGSTTSALVFLLMPAVVVFVDGQSAGTFGRERSPFTLLVPALAGLMGAGLILPFNVPAAGATQLRLGLLGLSACGAGVAAVRMHRMLAGRDGMQMKVLPSLACVCALNAVAASAFALRGMVWDGGAVKLEVLRCVVYHLPVLLLTGWLLRAMRPPAFAARVFLALVVTVVESYLILRPQLAWTTALGLVLLAGGGLGLLREDSEEVSAVL